MVQDSVQHGLHVRTSLGRVVVRQRSVEVLRLEGRDLRILSVHFAQQAFAVNLGNQSAGSFPFLMDSATGGAPFGKNGLTGLTTLIVDGTLRGAAAIVDAGLQLESIAQALHLSRTGSGKGRELRVLGGKLTLHGTGENRSVEAAESLRRSDLLPKGGTFHSGVDTAKALTQSVLDARSLHQVVAPNGVDVAPGTAQAVHDERIAESGGIPAIVAATAAVIAAVVPATVAPCGTNGTTNSAADQGTAPITSTTIAITTNVNHRSQAIHSHNIIPLF